MSELIKYSNRMVFSAAELSVCLQFLSESHPSMHLCAAVSVQFLLLSWQLIKLTRDVGDFLHLRHIKLT